MKTCVICNKEFFGRADAKFCSNVCRQQSKRNTKRGAVPLEERPLDISLTETDRDFNDFRPGFYTFNEESWQRECESCRKKFETHLELLRFCSRKCQHKFMMVLSGHKLADLDN